MIKHIAIVMDGNRRWAQKRSLSSWLGHKQGTETINHLIEFCLESGISIASVYTFSLENFKRPKTELDYLFQMLIKESEKILPKIINYGVKVRFCGDKAYFPDHIKPTIEKLESETKNLNKLELVILFCYGGQQEIINAIKNMALDVKNGYINPDNITQELFDKYLWTSGLPEPELIIRTGGTTRLSNFLLFKSAYSELYFTEQLWPDLTKSDLEIALASFTKRKRNFGV